MFDFRALKVIQHELTFCALLTSASGVPELILRSNQGLVPIHSLARLRDALFVIRDQDSQRREDGMIWR